MTNRRQRVITGRQWARWNTGEDVTALAAAAVARVDITTLIQADLPSLSNWTILRSLGELTLTKTASGFARVAYGVILVPSTVAITGMPDPVDEPHADWMFWGSTMLNQTAQEPIRISWDVRAMRRGRELESRIFFVIRNQHSSDAAQFAASGAMLLGLH